MKSIRFGAIIALSAFGLTACQTSQSGVSSYGGSDLGTQAVTDRGRVTTSAFVPRGNTAAIENTGQIANGEVERGVAPRVAAKPKPAPRRVKRRNTAVTPGTGETSDVAKPILAAVPKNEAAKNRYKNPAKAAPSRKARKKAQVSKKRRRGNRNTYRSIIAKHARANGVPLKLAMAVVQVESSYRANARGAAGEIGLMQILPRTARFIGYKGKMKNLYNPDTNIRYGMKYLGKAYKLGGGSTCGAILKYNAGHGAKRMNPISRRYCKRVARIMRKNG